MAMRCFFPSAACNGTLSRKEVPRELGRQTRGCQKHVFLQGEIIRERKDVTVEGLFHWFSASPFPMIR